MIVSIRHRNVKVMLFIFSEITVFYYLLLVHCKAPRALVRRVRYTRIDFVLAFSYRSYRTSVSSYSIVVSLMWVIIELFAFTQERKGPVNGRELSNLNPKSLDRSCFPLTMNRAILGPFPEST